MSFLTAIAMVFATTSLLAEGVNLLNNTGFKKDRTGFPAEWCYRRGKMAFLFSNVFVNAWVSSIR